jgi:predicted N-acetyltransferase YhbS
VTTSFVVRQEVEGDFRRVEELTRDAFWNLYVPGGDEHFLVHILRDSPDFIPELSLVAETDGAVVGMAMFTRGTVVTDDGGVAPVLVLGPIAVDGEHRRRGIARALIDHGAEIGASLGFVAIALYGFPEIYHRLGFEPGEKYGIRTPDDQYNDALQVRALLPGALDRLRGRHFHSPTFEQLEGLADDFEAFDATFPPKERLSGLPEHARYAAMGKRIRPAL